jgi:hypothetical protein
MSVVGSLNQGKAAQQAANYKAQQMEVNAGQERAASQRAAIEQQRKSRLIQSRAQAVGASSGSVLDPSTVNIMSGLAEEGELGALTALYQGESRARGYESEASISRYEGKQAKKAGQMAAFGAGLSGLAALGSFYGKYGSPMAAHEVGTTLPGMGNPLMADASLPWSAAYGLK